jgi:glycosyltransferase involved in cell wall biosynthesis
MRRLTVVQLLPALASGGVERSTLEVAEALVKSGHRSIVVSAGGPMVAPLLAGGSEHLDLDIGRKALASLRHVSSLRRLFAELQPDVVHARSRLPAWLAFLALRNAFPPRPHFVTTVHGLNSPGFYSGVMCRGERVICVSETVREHVLAHWPRTDPDRLTVIERGIDAATFSNAAGSTAAPLAEPRFSGQKLLLMPGRGTRLKGHAAAITLLADLRNAGVEAGLWLLGTREPGREDYVAELEGLAKSLGVADFMQVSEPRAKVVELPAGRRGRSSRPAAFRTHRGRGAIGHKPVVGWSHGGSAVLGDIFPRRSRPATSRPCWPLHAVVGEARQPADISADHGDHAGANIEGL